MYIRIDVVELCFRSRNENVLVERVMHESMAIRSFTMSLDAQISRVKLSLAKFKFNSA